MIEYYYRKIGTVDFEKSSEPKTVLPIRFKSMYAEADSGLEEISREVSNQACPQ